jgi:flagellar hook assembly protein FlgD
MKKIFLVLAFAAITASAFAIDKAVPKATVEVQVRDKSGKLVYAEKRENVPVEIVVPAEQKGPDVTAKPKPKVKK